MSIYYIGGVLSGIALCYIGYVLKNMYMDLYETVSNLRKEREYLREQLKNITRDIYSTQENVNAFYEWKKSRQ